MAILVVAVLVTVVSQIVVAWRARTWHAVLVSDVVTFAKEEEQRRASGVGGTGIDSLAPLRLSPGVTVVERISRPAGWQIQVRHPPTDQTCWGRWFVGGSASGYRTGCGPLPVDSLDPPSPPPSEVVTPRITLVSPLSPRPLEVGSPIVVSGATSSSTGPGPLTFEWTALPLASSAGVTRTLTFGTPGDYVVRLRVRGTLGGDASVDTVLRVGAPVPRVPTTLTVDGDTLRRQVPGVVTPAVRLLVRDQFGDLLPGVSIALSSSSGGSVGVSARVSDGSGAIGVSDWTVSSATPVLTATVGSLSAQVRVIPRVPARWEGRFLPTDGSSPGAWAVANSALTTSVAIGAPAPQLELRALDATNAPVGGAAFECRSADMPSTSSGFSPATLAVFADHPQTTGSDGTLRLPAFTATPTQTAVNLFTPGMFLTCRGQNSSGTLTSNPFWIQPSYVLLVPTALEILDAPAGTGVMHHNFVWTWDRGTPNPLPLTGRVWRQQGATQIPLAQQRVACRRSDVGINPGLGFGAGGPPGTSVGTDTVLTDAAGTFILPQVRLDPNEPWPSFVSCHVVIPGYTRPGGWPFDELTVEPWRGVAAQDPVIVWNRPTGYPAGAALVSTQFIVVDQSGRPAEHIPVQVLVNGTFAEQVRSGFGGLVSFSTSLPFVAGGSGTGAFRVEPRRVSLTSSVSVQFCDPSPPFGFGFMACP